MKILDFCNKYDLSSSFIIGHYGPGNYGDELLLEVLLNLIQARKPDKIRIYYSAPARYSDYHHDFGQELIDGQNKSEILKAFIASKNIIIGGGGIWGVDFNFNNFLMVIMLFFMRMLGKNVYLVAVGYYSTTTPMGHIGAFLAAKVSNLIIVRDEESEKNFKKYRKDVYKDLDLAFYINQIDISKYASEADKIGEILPIGDKTVLITLRRFNSKRIANNYNQLALDLIRQNPSSKFILLLCEPKETDPEGFAMISKAKISDPDILIHDFSFNPISFFMYLHNHADKIKLISPQFHMQLSAIKNGIKFYPISYDNKSKELFLAQNIRNFAWIQNLDYFKLKEFIKND